MPRIRLAHRFVFASLLVFFCVAPCAHAQVNSATILGTVSDPTGAAIAAAKVTAINGSTGFSRSVQSGSDGAYLIPPPPDW